MKAWRGARGPGRSPARYLVPRLSELYRHSQPSHRALQRNAETAAALLGMTVEPLKLELASDAIVPRGRL
jgi:hypothetical protein